DSPAQKDYVRTSVSSVETRTRMGARHRSRNRPVRHIWESTQLMEARFASEDAEPPSRVADAPLILRNGSPSAVRTQRPASSPAFFTPSAPAPKPHAPARREHFPISPASHAFRRRFFPGASAADWNDWRWQARSRVRDYATLSRILNLSQDEADAIQR